ncbi:cytochrome ubiquinol oxidase subunit I [Pelagibacterium luteolum]|uniref:Cytochrome d ubiquinol oxidase subunit I n=1 Tax=Pelagibacterium luteolum TaxID=440168 RepID=A0A1G7UZT0_9HYPH|nr:cytochrome ubiquinol oxidase subunit I [Pelagibacterium luteolum]SDG52761.1 cytochrome d ubiquinol oxidase subunit I [Pelagibacterium luteolum]
MVDELVVNLSRAQFAATALYHFLFVPLTLGLSFMMAIMESTYVMTGREIWRKMTLFWGTLFGINFAMGVATGIVMEFQFGMNWAYYSHYVGDVFGAPLAIEGLMAFFLEATFIGLFFFGWDRLSKVGHLVVTWLVALGANFSALWILIANGWMQYPVGAVFNPDTMRMEITDFMAVIFNPVAQAKFVHTVSAGYVTGAVFVFGVSALFLLKGKHIELAKRSMVVAASFGLASALSVVVLGDESGYAATEHQVMKIAAVEAMYHTEPAPAGLSLIAFPRADGSVWELKVPWVLGLITTRSFDTEVPGINELVEHAEVRIANGINAYTAMAALEENREDPVARETIAETWPDLGYALLLKRYRVDIENATPEEIAMAAADTVPDVWPLFWTFRLMVGIGLFFIGFFVFAFWKASTGTLDKHRWFLWGAVAVMPLPWMAAEAGWIIAEYGRQPWAIEGVLPTFYAASSLTVTDLVLSLAFYITVYTILAVIMVILMVKAIKAGPKDYVALLNGEPDPMETPEPKSDLPQSPDSYGDDKAGKPAPAE